MKPPESKQNSFFERKTFFVYEFVGYVKKLPVVEPVVEHTFVVGLEVVDRTESYSQNKKVVDYIHLKQSKLKCID
jgi:hypothetical protein